MAHAEGPLLILAGAGSGKTRVLTHRIAHLVRRHGVSPHAIWAVTFTNKASKEMRNRVTGLLGADLAPAWMGTFHSLGARVLRREIQHLDRDPRFVVYDEVDRVQMVKRAIADLGLDDRQHTPRAVAGGISSAKSELKDPAQVAREVETPFDQAVAQVYPRYEEGLAKANALDFDDLLLYVVRLWREAPEVLARYQERFRHLLVDEYQDTNRAQYLIINQLAARFRNLCVVGDDDQSVYGWRGADLRNILDFERDYPEAKVIKLEQNYRSSQVILDAAHGVVVANRGRRDKRLWTERSGGEPVVLHQAYDEQDEGRFVAAEIQRLAALGIRPGEIAVLYRMNSQSRAVEEALLKAGMPYRLVGGTRFYERREVKDVLAYLRLLVNPSDDVSFARVVNVPPRGIGARSMEIIEEAARERDLPLSAATAHLLGEPRAGGLPGKSAEGLRGLLTVLEELREDSLRRPLGDLLNLTLSRTGYRDHIRESGPEAEERTANLGELRTVAGQYEGWRPGDEEAQVEQEPVVLLEKFLEDLALLSDADSVEEGGGAVTLITMHMVKGLEFRVVLMVGMEEGLFPHSRAQGDESDLEEERRLCYVGMTRAKDRLYLVHAWRRTLYGKSEIHARSRFIDEIPPQLISGGGAGAARTTSAFSRPLAPEARAALGAATPRAAPRQMSAPLRARFSSGDRVRHLKFGEGSVVRSTVTRHDEELIVKFDGAGLKIISASLAPLERLSG